MNEKLTDKEFQKLITLHNSIAKSFKHRYKTPYDKGQAYLLDIFAENQNEVIELLRSEDIGKLKNYFIDILRKKLNIIRVSLKDKSLHKYKLIFVVEQLESIGKFDILATVSNGLESIFSMEYNKIKLVEQDNKDKVLYEIEVAGKPSFGFLDEDLLYYEVEKIVNETSIVKLKSLDISVNKRARVSIDSMLEYIDFTDDCFELEDKKELFYKHIEEFELTENEETFVNLTFKGYNIYSDIDVTLFQDSMKNKLGNDTISKNHLRKKFFDRLCKKITEKSPFID